MRSICGTQLMEVRCDCGYGIGSSAQTREERGSDLAFVVNHSGGKDSTRMLGFVRNNSGIPRPMW
jgi:hypothetical protein